MVGRADQLLNVTAVAVEVLGQNVPAKHTRSGNKRGGGQQDTEVERVPSSFSAETEHNGSNIDQNHWHFPSNLLDMWLKPRLFFIVLYEKRQVLGPVVLKVPGQVLVHIVLCYWDVEVRVQVAGVLCSERGPREPLGKAGLLVGHVLGCRCRDATPLRYLTFRYSELAFCPSRGALSMTLV